MTRFDPSTRQVLSARCAEFARLPDDPAHSGLKRAAVAVVVVPANDGTSAAFVLTKRTPRLSSHAGQWALPGGRLDAGETAVDAALRELHEEVGMPLAPAHVLGCLDDYPTRSGYLITPVVVWAEADTPMALNPAEVASVHRIELAQIASDQCVSFVEIPESPRKVIRLKINTNQIHAPTAAVLYQFRELMAGRLTRVNELEQPHFAWR